MDIQQSEKLKSHSVSSLWPRRCMMPQLIHV